MAAVVDFFCHFERSRDISNYSPSSSGARSFHRGFRVAINATFFPRDNVEHPIMLIRDDVNPEVIVP